MAISESKMEYLTENKLKDASNLVLELTDYDIEREFARADSKLKNAGLRYVRENYDEEDRGLSSFLNYRTIFLFGKVAMIIIVLFTFATAFKSMLGNKDPESQTPTIQTVTVTDKDIVTTYQNEEDETDFYLIFENGEKRRVSQSNYDDVQIDHTYYLGLTEQGNIFGIYDTDVYELPQGDK